MHCGWSRHCGAGYSVSEFLLSLNFEGCNHFQCISIFLGCKNERADFSSNGCSGGSAIRLVLDHRRRVALPGKASVLHPRTRASKAYRPMSKGRICVPTPADPWDEGEEPETLSSSCMRARPSCTKPLCGGTAVPEVLLTTRGAGAEWRVLNEALTQAFRTNTEVTPDHPAAAILSEANHTRLCAELRGLGRWEPGCYTRTTLHQSDSYVALLLCWSPGVMSPVVSEAARLDPTQGHSLPIAPPPLIMQSDQFSPHAPAPLLLSLWPCCADFAACTLGCDDTSAFKLFHACARRCRLRNPVSSSDHRVLR